MFAPLVLSGKVVVGFQRGGKALGCPTANLELENVEEIESTNGIYYGWAKLELQSGETIVCGMVTSIGWNPTFNDVKQKTVEPHLLRDFDFDFYGAKLTIVLTGKIREEKSFDSLEALKSAIASDIAAAKNFLSEQESLKALL